MAKERLESLDVVPPAKRRRLFRQAEAKQPYDAQRVWFVLKILVSLWENLTLWPLFVKVFLQLKNFHLGSVFPQWFILVFGLFAKISFVDRAYANYESGLSSARIFCEVLIFGRGLVRKEV